MEMEKRGRGRPRQYQNPVEKVREWRKRKRDDGEIDSRSLEVSFRIGQMDDHRIETLAARWKVGKSEVLRRLLAYVFERPEIMADLELQTTDKLHVTKSANSSPIIQESSPTPREIVLEYFEREIRRPEEMQPLTFGYLLPRLTHQQIQEEVEALVQESIIIRFRMFDQMFYRRGPNWKG